MTPEKNAKEIRARLERDFDIAETLVGKVKDIGSDNDLLMEALNQNQDWVLLVHRQSRLVLLLTQVLLAKGEVCFPAVSYCWNRRLVTVLVFVYSSLTAFLSSHLVQS